MKVSEVIGELGGGGRGTGGRDGACKCYVELTSRYDFKLWYPRCVLTL
jgi:hypothetical protein